jgi:hypothetical protein
MQTKVSFHEFSVQENMQITRNAFYRVYRGPGGTVHTRLYQERPHHGGEISTHDPVDWKEKVPADAVLKGSNGGYDNDFIKNYWVTWVEPGTLKALSIVLEDPVSVPLAPGDTLIDSPLQGTDGRLHVFFWRNGPSGKELFVHTFTGEPRKKGQVATQRLLAADGEPLFARAEPIPMRWVDDKGPERAGLAAVAWLTREAGGMRAHGVWQDGPDWKVFASDSIYGYAPFKKQRIGLWADPYADAIRLAWVMGRIDSDSLRVGEWNVEVRNGHQNIRIDEHAHGGSKVLATACVQLRHPEFSRSQCFYLTSTGNLYRQDEGRVSKLRDNVPPDYDFPIYASGQNYWEARVDSKGEIYLDTPSSGMR